MFTNRGETTPPSLKSIEQHHALSKRIPCNAMSLFRVHNFIFFKDGTMSGVTCQTYISLVIVVLISPVILIGLVSHLAVLIILGIMGYEGRSPYTKISKFTNIIYLLLFMGTVTIVVVAIIMGWLW